MKKKIVFMIINMNIGGTEKALLNMISEIPKDQYDITLLMLEECGGFLSSVPKEVNIEYLKEYKKIKQILNNPPQTTALSFLRGGQFIQAFKLISLHVASKIMKDRSVFFKYLLKDVPELKNQYDMAVAYAGPVDFISYFIMNKVIAKRKVQWIHFDITKIGFNMHFAVKNYNKFDKIYVVSKEAKKKLDNLIPKIKDKTEVFLNIISPQSLYSKSNAGKGFNDCFDGIRILTVGRLSFEKGQDLAIRVLARLIKDGHKVRWYCLGEGNSRKEYENLITIYNLQNQFVLLGSDPNPYSYMAQCDIYVQPSRHEGFCITLAEAKCFKKPIVTTEFTGANEQINDKETGLIVGIEEDQIYNAVKTLILNTKLCIKFSKNLSKGLTSNTVDLEKFYNIS
jgi:glycosyltransferase involved in cell wall biosynthesis